MPVREGSPEIPGPERVNSGEGAPPRTVDREDPRLRPVARLALDGAGVPCPGRVREERAQRVAPAIGRTAIGDAPVPREQRVAPAVGRTAMRDASERKPLPGRDAPPDEPEPRRDRPEGRDG